MIKNLLILGLMAWVTTAMAGAPHIAQEHMREAEAFKVEKPQKAEAHYGRSLAGSKIKKQKPQETKDAPESQSSELDSEVQYWQYSE